MKKIAFLFILFVLLLVSCNALKDTPGFYTGFHLLSQKQQESICFVEEQQEVSQCPDQRLKAINGHQLYGMLPNSDTVLLYWWSPLCSSDACVSISMFVGYCEEKKLSYLIIPDGYHVLGSSQLESYSGDLFFMNQKHYDVKYNPKLRKRFLKDFYTHYEEGRTKGYDWHRFYMLDGNQRLEHFDRIEKLDVFLKE